MHVNECSMACGEGLTATQPRDVLFGDPSVNSVYLVELIDIGAAMEGQDCFLRAKFCVY